MLAHSSSLNFCTRKGRKDSQNLKFIIEMEAQMEVECRWNLSANGISILNK
jgi:hypothetical protein